MPQPHSCRVHLTCTDFLGAHLCELPSHNGSIDALKHATAVLVRNDKLHEQTQTLANLGEDLACLLATIAFPTTLPAPSHAIAIPMANAVSPTAPVEPLLSPVGNQSLHAWPFANRPKACGNKHVHLRHPRQSYLPAKMQHIFPCKLGVHCGTLLGPCYSIFKGIRNWRHRVK